MENNNSTVAQHQYHEPLAKRVAYALKSIGYFRIEDADHMTFDALI